MDWLKGIFRRNRSSEREAISQRSLAEITNVTCPHCRHSYRTEMWIIVDAQERPDLAARCYDGTIHDVRCPKCAKIFTPDVPLMYHDEEARRLILASQLGTTPEQDKEVNRRLIAHLFPRIPGFYKLDYLNTTRVVPGVRGLQMLLQGRDPLGVFQEMPEQLFGDMASRHLGIMREGSSHVAAVSLPSRARMVRVIQAFVEADTWMGSKQVVEDHPELLSEDADRILEQLIALGRLVDENASQVLEEHRSLLQRCREIGVDAAFAEKMGRATAFADTVVDALQQVLEQVADEIPEAGNLLQKLRRARALQAALTAGAPSRFVQVLREYPELRDPETLEILDDLIREAQRSGHDQAANHMTKFRELLATPELLDGFARVFEAIPREVEDALRELIQSAGSPEAAMKLLAERGDLRRALTDAFLSTDDDDSPEGLIRRGNFLEQQGRWDEASECYLQALTAYEESNNLEGQIVSLSNLGDVTHQRGQYDVALTLYQRALQIAEARGDAEVAADLQASIAGVYVARGEYDRAEERFNKVLALINDERKTASLYNNMAILYERRGDYARAETLYNQAIGVFQRLGDKGELADVYINLGGLYARKRQDDKAMEMFERGLEIHLLAGHMAKVAGTYNNMAIIYERKGDYPKALEMYRKSLEISQELGADSQVAAIYGNMGGLYAKQGDSNQAIVCFMNSLKIAERIGEKDTTASIYFNLGLVYHQRGDQEQARRCFQRAKSLFAQLGDKEKEAASALLLLLTGAEL